MLSKILKLKKTQMKFNQVTILKKEIEDCLNSLFTGHILIGWWNFNFIKKKLDWE